MNIRRILVSGRVQGVGYGAWTAEQARSLGIDGWVRNRRDGTVEILAAGHEESVDALAGRCREGPRMARVDSVSVVPCDEEAPEGFEQRPTV